VNCNYIVSLNEHSSSRSLTEASPCPGPGLLSQHRNGMSLAVVMRFLTQGSTPSMPNQPPKIISTGNAFLTRKKKKLFKFPRLESFLISFFLSVECVCAFARFFYVLALCWSLCGLDLTKWHGTPQRIFFFYAVEVRSAPVGDLFSGSALYGYSTKRGSHKRLMRGREWGKEAGRQGGGDRAGSDEPQPKRKTHSFSSAGWEGGNSQLCRHNMTMNVCVGCEVPSCCDWQAGEEEKEMSFLLPTV